MRKLFKNARLILAPESGIAEGFLCEQDGIIQKIELARESPNYLVQLGHEEQHCDVVIDCSGDYLAPGLIDLHCHGAMGRDTMEATAEALDVTLNYHATRGTTLSVLTTVAASLEEMQCVLLAAGQYQKSVGDSRLGGIHLEGPYFSPKQRGAHREGMLRYPTKKETEQLESHFKVVSRMTIAPEIPGALELTRDLIRHGIAVSAGHSDATEEEARKGFESGVTQVTHLYNCMSSVRKIGGNRVTGLAEAALTTPGIICEVIADGSHLSPILLRLAWLAKGWKEVAIVSDATAGAGLVEGATFHLGGLSCKIENGTAWTAEGSGRRLAGSVSGMIDGVRIMVERVGVPLAEAVGMASLVPAMAMEIQEERGSLAQQKRADILQFSPEWEVKRVWSAGSRII